MTVKKNNEKKINNPNTEAKTNPKVQKAPGLKRDAKKTANKSQDNSVKSIDACLVKLKTAEIEDIPKILQKLKKFNDEQVLDALSLFIENASTDEEFHNAHDIFNAYGEKSRPYLEKLFQNNKDNFSIHECVIYSLFSLGYKADAQQKILALYEEHKAESGETTLQIIVDMFEIELYKEALKASTDFMNRGFEELNMILAVLLEFFESHLEIESWLRQQNDPDARNLIKTLDEVNDSIGELTLDRDSLEFFKIEDFMGGGFEEQNINELIFCYDLANSIANFVISYKEENYIDFLSHPQIKEFVFGLIPPIMETIKISARHDGILCDLEAPADELFKKDRLKETYERLFTFFWEDMKLIYGGENEIAAINIDYFAWKISCTVYNSLKEFITKNGGIVSQLNNEDESFIKFIFNISEEIVTNVEEYVTCPSSEKDNGDNNSNGGGTSDIIFNVDEHTVKMFKDMIRKAPKKIK